MFKINKIIQHVCKIRNLDYNHSLKHKKVKLKSERKFLENYATIKV